MSPTCGWLPKRSRNARRGHRRRAPPARPGSSCSMISCTASAAAAPGGRHRCGHAERRSIRASSSPTIFSLTITRRSADAGPKPLGQSYHVRYDAFLSMPAGAAAFQAAHHLVEDDQHLVAITDRPDLAGSNPAWQDGARHAPTNGPARKTTTRSGPVSTMVSLERVLLCAAHKPRRSRPNR